MFCNAWLRSVPSGKFGKVEDFPNDKNIGYFFKDNQNLLTSKITLLCDAPDGELNEKNAHPFSGKAILGSTNCSIVKQEFKYACLVLSRLFPRDIYDKLRLEYLHWIYLHKVNMLEMLRPKIYGKTSFELVPKGFDLDEFLTCDKEDLVDEDELDMGAFLSYQICYDARMYGNVFSEFKRLRWNKPNNHSAILTCCKRGCDSFIKRKERVWDCEKGEHYNRITADMKYCWFSYFYELGQGDSLYITKLPMTAYKCIIFNLKNSGFAITQYALKNVDFKDGSVLSYDGVDIHLKIQSALKDKAINNHLFLLKDKIDIDVENEDYVWLVEESWWNRNSPKVSRIYFKNHFTIESRKQVIEEEVRRWDLADELIKENVRKVEFNMSNGNLLIRTYDNYFTRY